MNVALLTTADQKYLCLIEVLNKILESESNSLNPKSLKTTNAKNSNQVIVFFSTKYHVELFSALYTKFC